MKIGVIGVCVKCWVMFYGFVVNVDFDLGYFGGIVLCGLFEFFVISFKFFGVMGDLVIFDVVLVLMCGVFFEIFFLV